MVDDVRDITAYYHNDPDREHGRLDRHQLEYELTWRYFSQYLPSHGSILEIGAATGRYTLELARRGYTLTAVDLSATLLDLCRRAIASEGLERQVSLIVADARDLGQVMARDFDVVLLMGPLYHLVVEDDRKLALREAFNRLKPGCLIFSTFISRLGLLGDLLKNMPGWIEDQADVRSVIGQGKDPDTRPRGGFRGYFASASEIAPLHEAAGFETIALAGVEPAISADDESFNGLEGNQRQRWLDLLFSVSTEPSILGASRHLLYVGRKVSA